jgi:hypothetical protein
MALEQSTLRIVYGLGFAKRSPSVSPARNNPRRDALSTSGCGCCAKQNGTEKYGMIWDIGDPDGFCARIAGE